MRNRLRLGVLALLVVSAASCGRSKPGSEGTGSDPGDLPAPRSGFLADVGFRPKAHGYAFRNQAGGLINPNVVQRLFGKDACAGGNTKSCKLTPAALKWAQDTNRRMSIGQCEGMAVSALTFFKKIDDPARVVAGATSAHGLSHAQAGDFIGYYWAYQILDNVYLEKVKQARSVTPVNAEDRLVGLMKKNELATLAIIQPGIGGHAVTPYAVEDRGNGVHWIRVYDNNRPDEERYIIIDRTANTWTYNAALNPSVREKPWSGNAETKTMFVLPLQTRLTKAVCPFCKGSKKRTLVPSGTTLTVTDQEGRKIGLEDGKVVNDIPDAEIVEPFGYLEGGPATEPVIVLPEGNEYDITVTGRADQPDGADDAGVTVFSDGAAVALETGKRKAEERDTLSLPREGTAIRFRSGTGKLPVLNMAVDDDKGGITVRIANLVADPDDEVEVEVDVDRSLGRLSLQGGGKSTTSYDLRLNRVREDSDDEEVEEKGIKFRLGERHSIDTTSGPAKGVKVGAPAGFKIARGAFVRKPKALVVPPKGPVVAPKGAPVVVGPRPGPMPAVAPRPQVQPALPVPIQRKKP